MADFCICHAIHSAVVINEKSIKSSTLRERGSYAHRLKAVGVTSLLRLLRDDISAREKDLEKNSNVTLSLATAAFHMKHCEHQYYSVMIGV